MTSAMPHPQRAGRRSPRAVLAAADVVAHAIGCAPSDVLASHPGAKRTVRLARAAIGQANDPVAAIQFREAVATLAAHFGAPL